MTLGFDIKYCEIHSNDLIFEVISENLLLMGIQWLIPVITSQILTNILDRMMRSIEIFQKRIIS